MNSVQNYYYCFNSILISKVFINFLGNVPKVKKLSFFFIINLKTYKKNLLLFYIMISLIFGGSLVLKRHDSQGLQIFNIFIKKKKIYVFFLLFINFYLPLLNIVENSVKKGHFFKFKNHNFLHYRLNYFSFPVILEFDVLYLECEAIYNFVNSYRFQLDIYIKSNLLCKDSGEILLRFFRFPCVLQLRNNFF
jgi:hypothetical protein